MRVRYDNMHLTGPSELSPCAMTKLITWVVMIFDHEFVVMIFEVLIEPWNSILKLWPSSVLGNVCNIELFDDKKNHGKCCISWFFSLIWHFLCNLDYMKNPNGSTNYSSWTDPKESIRFSWIWLDHTQTIQVEQIIKNPLGLVGFD